MLNFLKVAFGPGPNPERQLSTDSFTSSTESLDIRVGKPPHARAVHIPQCALRACTTLRQQCGQGSTIINADPIVFEVILEYLDGNGLFGKMRPYGQNPLEQLVGGSDQMLKLVKAWHLAEMLNLPHLQNKLIDTFRVLYAGLLKSRIRMPLCPEPFVYLRNHMSYHTKVEKFLVDFYAGLARFGEDFRAEEFQAIPKDIAQHLRHRRAYLVKQGRYGDRIARGDSDFNVSKSDDTQRTMLQVSPSLVPPTESILVRPSSRRAFSASTLPSMRPRSPIPPSSPRLHGQQNSQNRGHRTRLSLPSITNVTGHPEIFVPRGLIHTLQSTQGANPRPKQPDSSPVMTSPSNRAPFMDSSPSRYRRQSQMMADDSSSDDGSVYDLFFENLPALNISQQHPIKANKK
ncbi:uncharacterized protein K460DRAFT_399091 [Cucurbitaria berberidis CBS 394.84]|uniref:BTB domain-containing protein n=1 Tax=Cucurbitaria berberidis CBS 394.84 TaxID=1168544 RepID=A0A9P4G906_9PLEO|nr:uncharacterized protein K460DRAFT_399091 [Cucurbitaria berberidis CBS 394.84]KAF1841277.1 hypothetical protein K460DRAFT_399091 [Cucurbitaria berberidis CBS 394.84]